MQKIAPCNGVFLCVIHKHHLPRAVQKRHAAPHAGQGRSGRVLCQPLHRAAQQSVRYMQAFGKRPVEFVARRSRTIASRRQALSMPGSAAHQLYKKAV